jgi:hypothetical protein
LPLLHYQRQVNLWSHEPFLRCNPLSLRDTLSLRLVHKDLRSRIQLILAWNDGVLFFCQQKKDKPKRELRKKSKSGSSREFCLGYDPVVWILVLDLHRTLP